MKKYLIIFLLLFSFSNNVYLKNKPFLDLNKLNNIKSLSINKEQIQTNQNDSNEFNNQQVIQQQKNQQISQHPLQQQQIKNIEIQEENLNTFSKHDRDLISKLEQLIQPVKQSLKELIRLQTEEEINIFQPQFLINEFDTQSEQIQQQQQQNFNNNQQENLLTEQQIIQNNYQNSKQIQQLSKPVIDELNHIVDNLPEGQNFPKQSLNEIKDFIPQNFAGNKIIDEIQDAMQEQIVDKKDIKNLVQQINNEVQQQKQNYENSIDNIGEQVEVNDQYIRTYEDLLKQINEQQQQKQQLINVLENKENIIEEQLLQNPQNNFQLQLNLDNFKENLQQKQEQQQLIYDDNTKVYVDYLKNIVDQPENQIPSQIIQEVFDEAKSEHLEQPILDQMQNLLTKNQNEQIPTQNIEKTLNNIQYYVKKNKRDFNKKQTQFFDSFQQQNQNEKQSFNNVFDINEFLNNIIKRVRNVQKTLNDIKYEFEIPKVLNEKPNNQMFNQLNQNAKNNQIPNLNEFVNEDNYYQFE